MRFMDQRRLLAVFLLTIAVFLFTGCSTMTQNDLRKLSDQELLIKLRQKPQNSSDPIEQTLAYIPLVKELMFNRDIAFDNQAMKGVFDKEDDYGGRYKAPFECLNNAELTYSRNPVKPNERYVSAIIFRLYKVRCGQDVTLADIERGFGVKIRPHVTYSIDREPLNWMADIKFKSPEYKFFGQVIITFEADRNLPADTIFPPTTKVSSFRFSRSIWFEKKKSQGSQSSIQPIHPLDSCPQTGYWRCQYMGGETGLFMRQGDRMPGESFVNDWTPRESIVWYLVKAEG